MILVLVAARAALAGDAGAMDRRPSFLTRHLRFVDRRATAENPNRFRVYRAPRACGRRRGGRQRAADEALPPPQATGASDRKRRGRSVLAGIAAGLCLLAYELFLADTVDNTSIDILHFSLHPWDPARIALAVGLLGFHAAAFWAMVTIFLAARSRSRIRSASSLTHVWLVALWIGSAAIPFAIAASRGFVAPLGPAMLVVVLAAAAASTARRWLAWFRHSAQATRILTLFVALFLPALAMYPSVLHFAEAAKARLIETQYAVQAAAHPEELIAKLRASLGQIDRIPGLADTLTFAGTCRGGAPQTDSAFFVWRQTDLAQFRLTSAVELYGVGGSLLSRFALNFPEYTPSELRHLIGAGSPEGSDQQAAAGVRTRSVSAATRAEPHALPRCQWDLFGEASPFGSEERRMLHAERGICRDGKSVGAIVVHVMLDYDTLPFISSQSPYFEFFRDAEPAAAGGHAGPRRRAGHLRLGPSADLHLGHGRVAAGRASCSSAVQSSRQPFWTDVSSGTTRRTTCISPTTVTASTRWAIPALTLVRSLRPSRGVDDPRRAGLRRAGAGRCALQPRRARTRTGRRAGCFREIRDKLLSQAVPRVRGRRGGAGRHPGVRRSAPTSHALMQIDIEARGGAHGRRRAARDRGIGGAAAARRRIAGRAERRRDGVRSAS